jgi:thiosulfate dehydrogenase [quinone] large subunit
MSTLRRYVTPLAVLAAAIVLYIEAPWGTFGLGAIEPSKDVSTILAFVFWVLAIIVIVALFQDRKQPEAQVVEVEGPAFTRYLFSNTRAGLLWLPIRIFLGFAWLEAGLHKLFPVGKAVGAGWLDGGASLQKYWTGAVAIPDTGSPKIAFEWYRDFLNILLSNDAFVWFAFLIVFGEIAVGLGLLTGTLTGVAAFFGALMNMSFLLAGSSSSNPVLFTMAIGLILAWRVAGYYGIDRYLLPMLGVPWRAKVKTRPVTGGPQTAPAPS